MADMGAQLAVIRQAGLTNDDYTINIDRVTVTINNHVALLKLSAARTRENADVIMSILRGTAPPLNVGEDEEPAAIAARVVLHLGHTKAVLVHDLMTGLLHRQGIN